MIELLQTILAMIVALGLLVTFHEYGHFWVARRCGVKVLRFSVGFGKPLLSWYDRHGTEFVIAAFPLGGYVKMLDAREGPVAESDQSFEFTRKPVSQRIAIVVAGPVANFILAIIAFWLMLMIGIKALIPVIGEVKPESPAANANIRSGYEIVAVGDEQTVSWYDINIALLSYIGDTGKIPLTLRPFSEGNSSSSKGALVQHELAVDNWLAGVEQPKPLAALGISEFYPKIPAVVGELMEGYPAVKAGMKPGDEILSVNDKPVVDWSDWVQKVKKHPNQSLQVEIRRNGIRQVLTVTPGVKQSEAGSIGFIGASPQAVSFPDNVFRDISYAPHDAFIVALSKTWSMTALTLSSIKKMIEGVVSVKNLSGPITIAKVAGDTARSGIESFLNFLAILSISLGVLNLLPIPILDGGHLVYYLIEWVKGSPVSQKAQEFGSRIGIALIITMMFVAFYNDLSRL
ncbi:RIP metalloprotease RseP [Zooshikella ganghwensis]|uniref:RIP metalloprotease RseP n=1 Tax=Zooshikella ganghwensis TaxID=202772 RepID=UPI001F22D314|nr:RIP metalloprotease RseP [Zooshikella ganghwensis]